MSTAGMAGDVENLIHTNRQVSTRLGRLNADMEQRGQAAPEVFVSQIFTQANSDILEAFKRDVLLVHRFNQAQEQLSVPV